MRSTSGRARNSASRNSPTSRSRWWRSTAPTGSTSRFAPCPAAIRSRRTRLPSSGRTMADVQVRHLEPREWAGLFEIVVQLRPHVDQEEFLARVRRQTHGGYELIGAFRDGRLLGVLGMRPVHTLVRGPHLHIDD